MHAREQRAGGGDDEIYTSWWASEVASRAQSLELRGASKMELEKGGATSGARRKRARALCRLVGAAAALSCVAQPVGGAGLDENGTVSTPRCEALADRTWMRRVEDLSFPWHNGGDAYVLESESGDCVYEIFDRDRMLGACLKDQWLISLGGSNAQVFNQNVAKMFVGNELQEELFPRNFTYVNPWDPYVRMERPIDVVVKTTDAGTAEEVVCANHDSCMEVNGTQGLTYFSGFHHPLLEHIIPELEQYRVRGLNLPANRPPPHIFIQQGAWQEWCRPGGLDYTVCDGVRERVELSNSTYDEVTAGDLEQVLAYLRDSWPLVEEVHMDQRYYFSEISDRFTEEFSLANGYPRVHWYSSAELYYDVAKEDAVMKSNSHYFARHAMLKAQWFLNHLCSALPSGPFDRPMMLYEPECVPSTREGVSYAEDAMLPCLADVVGRDPGLLPAPAPGDDDAELGVVAPWLLEELGVGAGNASASPPAGDNNNNNNNGTSGDEGDGDVDEFVPASNELGPYRIAVTTLCTLVLVLCAANVFYGDRIYEAAEARGLCKPCHAIDDEVLRNVFSGFEVCFNIAWNAAAAVAENVATGLGIIASGAASGVLYLCRGRSSKNVCVKDLAPRNPEERSRHRSVLDQMDRRGSGRMSTLSTRTSQVIGEHVANPRHSSALGSFSDGEELVSDLPQPVSTARRESMIAAAVGAKLSAFAAAGKQRRHHIQGGADLEEGPRPVVPKDDGAATRATPRLEALGVARFIASVHIVVGHLYTKEGRPFPMWHTHQFGFTWVPFFMMLSGFVLAYARLNSSNPDKRERVTLFLWKRLRGIYPLYLCGLLARAAQIAALKDEFALSLGSPAETAASLLLLQAWVPSLTEQVLQAHCWFLSCIVPYWALHQTLFKILRTRSNRFLFVFVACVAVLPAAMLAIVPLAMGKPVNWYNAHDWGATRPIDLAVVVLKFHPVSYLHIYCTGIVAAVLMQRFRENPPIAFRFGASAAYIVLYGLFVVSNWAPLPGFKLSYRLGLLAPLQALLLIGLSLGEDPVARLFALHVFRPLENLSYPQYVFQFIAYYSWLTWAGWGFWAWLMTLSALGYYFVQKPLKSARKPFRAQFGGTVMIFGIAMLVAVVTFLGREALLEHNSAIDDVPGGNGGGGGDSPSPTVPELPILPDTVTFKNGIVDQRVNTVVQRAMGREDPTPTLINPSFLWVPETQEMWLAVRKHQFRVEVQQMNTDDIVWESDVLVGRVNATTFVPLEDFSNPYKAKTLWSPCQMAEYDFVDANSTSFRFRTTGPEDPRLFLYRGQVQMSTNIAAPVDADTPMAECRLGRRMLFGPVPVTPDAEPVAARLLQDPELVTGSTEKNWLAFEHEERLLFVRSILPFTVVSVGDGTLPERVSTRIESSVFDATLVRGFLEGDADFHGGTNPVVYNRTLDNSTHYLAAFHTKGRKDGHYRNFLFEFSRNAAGEWRIDRISRELRLLEAPLRDGFGVSQPMTFLSGLTAKDDGVLLSYGSTNQESRVRFIPWPQVAALFAA